jgi:hypothetical protein
LLIHQRQGQKSKAKLWESHKGQVVEILEETFASLEKMKNFISSDKALPKIDAIFGNARLSTDNYGISNRIHLCHTSK